MLFISNKDKKKKAVIRVESLLNVDVYSNGDIPYVHNYGHRTTVGEFKKVMSQFDDDVSLSICLDEDDELSIFIGEYILTEDEEQLRNKWKAYCEVEEKKRVEEKEKKDYKLYQELKLRYESTV